jgi:hypothetical protein
MFITSAASKSGVLRRAPTPAMRTWVCAAPGVSTMISLASVCRGVGIDGRTGLFPVHSENACEASFSISGRDIAPTTTSAALPGTICCFQKPSIASRASVLLDASVPISMYPYG